MPRHGQTQFKEAVKFVGLCATLDALKGFFSLSKKVFTDEAAAVLLLGIFPGSIGGIFSTVTTRQGGARLPD